MDTANKILYKEESFAIIGACMKVHRSLAAGFQGGGIRGSTGKRIPHSENSL